MSRKRFSPEQIIGILREADVKLSRDRNVGQLCREMGIIQTLYIEPGSPWENGYIENFNGKLRNERLNGEIFYTLREAQVLIKQWRPAYNTLRPHSSLNYRPPDTEGLAALRAHLLAEL